MSTLTQITDSPRGLVRVVGRLSERLGVSRRGFLLGAAVAGSATVVDPVGYLLRPQTAYATVCGPGAGRTSGWTVFCCTINKGVNACPPGSFAAGWWKAADSSWCCGGYRYIVDCNAKCTKCGCARGSTMCAKKCWNCSCGRGSRSTCDQRRVCCNAFRYGQCNTQVRCSGGVVCRVASCVPPYTFESCTRTSLRDDRTKEHNAPCLQGCGPILRKYNAMGAQRSYLKGSRGPERAVGDGVGRYVHYQGGAIYWTSKTGARSLTLAALTAYNNFGGPRGQLGYPLTDSGTTAEWTQRFQHGLIVKGPRTTPQVLWREVLTVWQRMGSGAGILNYPSGPLTHRKDGGGEQPFRNGVVIWSRTTRPFGVARHVYLAWIKAGGATGRYGYPLSDTEQLANGKFRGRFQGGTITAP